ncbi:YusU family protein [Brevibacillus ruminantium]|uniref:YusU family protein n=1 Tax=Brevibacillus ruminantium TaxID=2950604 RepID=A0ABY4WJC9_9BACL|nr:YusU family protein [Brevibacillus ruminantium]USG66167.1 YusU family protein [Brevibacillus ruminantium]
MNDKKDALVPELDDLLYKFTELLTGEATPERVEMVKVWCLYAHMSKVMPPLIQHWGSEPEHADAKNQIRDIIEQIKQWNQTKNQKH